MNELLTTKNEALADIDYFIHEIEENGVDNELVKELLETGKVLILKTDNIQFIKDHLAICVNIFQKAFQ